MDCLRDSNGSRMRVEGGRVQVETNTLLAGRFIGLPTEACNLMSQMHAREGKRWLGARYKEDAKKRQQRKVERLNSQLEKSWKAKGLSWPEEQRPETGSPKNAKNNRRGFGASSPSARASSYMLQVPLGPVDQVDTGRINDTLGVVSPKGGRRRRAQRNQGFIGISMKSSSGMNSVVNSGGVMDRHGRPRNRQARPLSVDLSFNEAHAKLTRELTPKHKLKRLRSTRRQAHRPCYLEAPKPAPVGRNPVTGDVMHAVGGHRGGW